MIYFITDGEATKIGYSKDPWGRLATLQTATPRDLTIRAVIPGDKAVEAELHCMFDDRRVRGEWFDLDDVDMIRAQVHILRMSRSDVEAWVLPRVSTWAESSEDLGVSRRTLRRRVSNGNVETFRVGDSMRYREVQT